MFNINQTKLREGLEEALKYQINIIESLVEDINTHGRGNNYAVLDDLKKKYSAIAEVAARRGIDIRDYNLTCSRLLERLNRRTLK